MRKIYTKSVFEYNPSTGRYEVNENESRYHYIDDQIPMTEMKGGGSRKPAPPQVVAATQPWQPQQPYLTGGYKAAQDAYLNQQPDFSFSPETEQAFGMITDRARAGSPLNTAGSDYLQRELGGDYLYGGQGFDAAYNAARNKIIPDVQSQFEKYGRSSGGLARVAETGALGDAFAKQYETERALQQDALRFAPQFANAPYEDAAKLASVGLARETQRNAPLDARREAVKAYLDSISGKQGETKTVPGSNMPAWLRTYLASTSGFIKGGIAGASTGNPYAAVGGAIGGGVGGGLDSYYQ